ncbi:MAG TPA: glutamine synthetase, partial [Actinomycetota bacterium]|nr:glutamine synthetase [Actinomycetota bacterium]
EPLLRRIRLAMTGAGMHVEGVKGECNHGQHEIVFRYADALTACDDHVVYKTGAKEIAAQEGMAITFMAKYDQREGNSCHIHLSLRADDGALVLADGNDPEGLSAMGRCFIAGQIAHMRDLSLLFAPNINSFKRFVAGSFAPTAIKWGRDNRTCALRLVGHGESLRLENRSPGGDVNPYLAVGAMVAAGLDGIERNLPLEPPVPGNAYQIDSHRLPDNLTSALELWERSEFVARTFGEDVQQHYANMARIELQAFGAAVTDWERYRGFERL